jgi:hypothetical protein
METIKKEYVTMKKQLLILPLLFAGALVFGQNRQFDWSIALVNRLGGAVLAADRPVQMQTGDVFNFLLKSEADCFVYVTAQSSDNEVFVFYSGAIKKDEEIRIGPVEITVPSGTETFFVITSVSPQRKLEQAVESYERSPNSSRAARALLNEVFVLRRAVSALDQNPEQPVFMGGAFRGGDDTVPAIKFSGAETYVRTFTISH